MEMIPKKKHRCYRNFVERYTGGAKPISRLLQHPPPALTLNRHCLGSADLQGLLRVLSRAERSGLVGILLARTLLLLQRLIDCIAENGIVLFSVQTYSMCNV